VTDSDGTRYFFGLTSASRLEDGPGRVFAWYPELIAHRSGDSVSYQYLRDRNQLYVERLTWGPNDRFQAVLSYQGRHDPVESFIEGLRVTTGLPLASVQVRSLGIALRTYHLS
jgi:hypothetical protein